MCGRFVLTMLEDFIKDLPWVRPPDELPPASYNIAPTHPVAVVPNTPDHRVDFFHWGLVPAWAKDPSIGSRMINARAESLAEKPAFRRALQRRRCLIPADGFYEWRKEPNGRKTPLFIRRKDRQPLALAGLWETWHDPGGSQLNSCTIITTEPNDLIRDIHDRMPAVLQPGDYQRWLDPEPRDPPELKDLLKPYPAELMEAYPVSRAVNSPKNNSPTCVEPIAPDPPPKKKGMDQPGLFGT